jgi:hypothetical protein
MTRRNKRRQSPPAERREQPPESVEDEVREDFDERQDLSTAGRRRLADRIEQHNMNSPDLSAGDIDAHWEDKNVGDEHLAGHSPTPDQDVVDEMGAAVGLSYADTEPLDYGKISDRDRNRWELDPDSALDEDEVEEDDEDGVDDDEDPLLFWDDVDDLDEEVEGEVDDDDETDE